jgi:branched-chain amino acid aminotransferase
MERYCYFNEKIIPAGKAHISPRDLGILRGYAVFDVMCTQNGKPFLFSEHWKRLRGSAKELGLVIPLKSKEYERIILKLVKANGFKKSTVRTVLSGGISSDGFSLDKGKETFYILVDEFKELPKEVFEKGARAITLEYAREIPRAKIASYIFSIRNYHRKIKAKALEMIYVKDGIALEASTSNFFIVKNGIVITPKEEILLGITRNLSVRLAKKAKLKVEEREVKLSELFDADEVFLSATNKDIVPVVRIDGKKIGDGKVGETTKKMMEFFGEFMRNY